MSTSTNVHLSVGKSIKLNHIPWNLILCYTSLVSRPFINYEWPGYKASVILNIFNDTVLLRGDTCTLW